MTDSIEKNDIQKFFDAPEEFSNNPVHFLEHRIFNVPTHTDLSNALVKLERGDWPACKERIEKAMNQLVEMKEFMVRFGKELDKRNTFNNNIKNA